MNTVLARLVFLLVASLLMGGCASLGTNPAENTTETKSPELLAAEFTRGGDHKFTEKKYQEALVQYMLALEQDRTNADTFYKVGTIHRLQNNLDLAERSFKESMRLSPGHISSREGLGLVSLRKENYSYAKVLLEGVLKSDEKRFESMNALAVLHDLQKEYDIAQQYYLQALTIFPRSSKLLNNLGYSYYLQQNWQEAEKYFKQAVTYQPSFSQGWSNLALAYMQQGQDENARLAFEKTVENHQALNNMGYFEFLRNNSDEARKNFKEAVKSSPSYYAVAQQNLASIGGVDGTIELVEASSTSKITARKTNTTSPLAIAVQSNSDNQPKVDDESPAAENLDIESNESANTTTVEQVLIAQEKLTDLGYDPGPIDGVIGTKTLNAVRAFQRDNGYSVDGVIDNTLLGLL